MVDKKDIKKLNCLIFSTKGAYICISKTWTDFWKQVTHSAIGVMSLTVGTYFLISIINKYHEVHFTTLTDS